ncbi:hypothetical protein HY003_02720 [Candidatus Saccharibacteria bacterium]|nr:hypothetical protein [Candidatus Saccharibacteria bacterium]MBI3338187.1 hypothetical protein [Candidatus Saccharibacteria bacterium]
MWLINRRKDKTTNAPVEVQDFYRAEKRERVGVAWLLALATFVVTIVLALGLFFGGRFIYRKIRGNDRNPQPSSGITQNPQSNQGGNGLQDNNKTPASSPSNQPSTVTPTPSTATSDTAPNSSTSLPNTGPANTLAVFAVVTLAGTTIYQIRLRYSNRD